MKCGFFFTGGFCGRITHYAPTHYQSLKKNVANCVEVKNMRKTCVNMLQNADRMIPLLDGNKSFEGRCMPVAWMVSTRSAMKSLLLLPIGPLVAELLGAVRCWGLLLKSVLFEIKNSSDSYRLWKRRHKPNSWRHGFFQRMYFNAGWRS